MTESPIARPLMGRKRSGLVRELGTADVFVFNTLGYALGLVLAIMPTFLGGLYPDANVYLVLTLGTVLTVCNGLVYGLFASAMPQSGGDHIYVQRTFRSPGLGFIANWGFTWSQLLGLGVYAAWCVTEALGPAISTFGFSVKNPQIVELGTSVTEPTAVFLIGTALLVTVLLVSLAGLRWLKRFLNLFFLVALAGTIAMSVIFIVATRSHFHTAFDSFMASYADTPNAYVSIVQRAQELGLATEQPTRPLAALLALPIGYWAFIGFTYSAYIGGEVRRRSRAQLIGILGSLAFGYVVYMVTLGAYYNVVGRDFNNAVAMLQSNSTSPIPVAGSMSFFAGVITESPILNLLLSVSTFLWFYLLLFVMATFCARNVFSWSFYRIVPTAFQKVSSRSGAPWVAIVVVLTIAEMFLAAQAFLGITFMNYIAMFSICFLITGLAALAYPYLRPGDFNRNAPSLAKRRVLGVPLMSIAGAGNTLLFATVLFSALTNPGVSGVEGAAPHIVLLVVYGAGLVFYQIARTVRRRQGIDLRLLADEIPAD